MKKLLLLIAVLMAVFVPTSAHAGTCNPSYDDSLPQTSGTVGSVSLSTSNGQITKMEAIGDGFDWTYVPPGGGAPVAQHISLGTGVICEHWQEGGWDMPAPSNTLRKIKFEYGGSPFHTVGVINGSTQPMNVFECWGVDLFPDGAASWEFNFPAPGTITKIAAGPGTQDLTFSGYDAASGTIISRTTRAVGSCHVGSDNAAHYEEMRVQSTDTNEAWFDVSGSGGITSVEFFVDGVSKGTDSTPSNNMGSSEYYFELATTGVTEGLHTVTAKASFSVAAGTVSHSRQLFFSKREVAAGNSFTCALNDIGMVTCWGANGYGQTGNASFATPQNNPLSFVRGGAQGGTYLQRVTDISAGTFNACAVADGGVLCWGRNQNGILAQSPGTLASSNVPVWVIPPGSGVHMVSVGGRHACALSGSGSSADVKCWGGGSFGQLGNGSTAATDTTPGSPANLGWYDTKSIGAGTDTTWILKTTGELYAFGRDNYGQLGNGATLANVSVPVLIASAGATELWPGTYHVCARITGSTKCWGSNVFGEVGINMTSSAVATPTTAIQWAGQTIKSMYLGDSISCIVRTNGRASCLGYNAYGALGMGYTSTQELSSKTPTEYQSGVDHLSIGLTHACGFDDGVIKCAGDNTEHQIFWFAGNPQLTPYSVL